MPDDQPPVPSSEHQSFKFNDQVMATAFLCSHERDINSLPSGKVQLAMHLVLNFFCLDARCRPPAGLFFFFLVSQEMPGWGIRPMGTTWVSGSRPREANVSLPGNYQKAAESDVFENN